MVNTALVTDFVNSLDLMPYTENLGTPEELVACLAGHDRVPPGERATGGDVEAAQRLREAIRDFAGGDVGAGAELDRAAQAAKLGVRFADGEARGQAPRPRGGGGAR